MEKLKQNIILYIKYISVIIKSAMQYKLSFVLMAIGRFFISFGSFLGIYFLFSTFSGIKSYSFNDVMLCFSIITLSFAIAECVGSGFCTFSTLVKVGSLDRMLLRPRSLILQVLGTRFEIGRVGAILTAIIMFVVGVNGSNIDWTILRIAILILMIIGGTLLFIALFMIGATLCFFSIEDTRYINILTYGAKEHGKYPFDVYGKGIMGICTYIVPYTLVQYYPLQYLLGKSDNWIYGLYPLGTIGFITLCYGFWRFGLKHYKSTGS